MTLGLKSLLSRYAFDFEKIASRAGLAPVFAHLERSSGAFLGCPWASILARPPDVGSCGRGFGSPVLRPGRPGAHFESLHSTRASRVACLMQAKHARIEGQRHLARETVRAVGSLWAVG